MSLKPDSILNNRYRIEAILGEGGMGAVYRAIDHETKQPCAVKEFRLKHLPTDQEVRLKGKEKAARGGQNKEDIVTREKALSQFKREADLLAGLNHANLPKVTNYFPVGEDYYLVMTLIEGKNAAALLASMGGKPLPERAVLVWVKQVLDALVYCHARGVIHRDVKPANIILTVSGVVYLVDFGIAKEENPTKETSIGARVITPGYSPPEQYSLGRTDARSDIYSLGATLYAMLTGKEPVDSINRLMGMEMLDIHQLAPQVSPHLMSAVCKAIALKPEDRFQTMQEMHSAVFSPVKSVVRAESEAGKPAVKKNSGLDMPPTAAMPARAAQAMDLPTEEQPAWKINIKSNSQQLQNLFELDSGSKEKMSINLFDSIQNIIWSPRGHAAAITTTEGIYFYNGSAVKFVMQDQSGWISNYKLAFSSDGAMLAVGCGIDIQVWNIKSEQKIRDLKIDEAYQIMGLHFLPHGALLVAATSLTEGSARIWEIQSKRELLSLQEEGRMIGDIVFSRTGKLVAIGWMGAAVETKKNGVVRIWNLTARMDMGSHLVMGDVLPSMDFSPDDKLLAIGTAQALHKKNLRIIKMPAIKGKLFDQDHASLVTKVMFSPQGKILSSVGDDGTIKIWPIEAKSEMLVESLESITDASTIAFTLDGKMLMIGTTKGNIYFRPLA